MPAVKCGRHGHTDGTEAGDGGGSDAHQRALAINAAGLQNATEIEIEGMRVLMASLDDLMRMKRAADRPKDRIELEILAAVKEEREKLGL